MSHLLVMLNRSCVTFSSEGSKIVSECYGGTIQVRDESAGKLACRAVFKRILPMIKGSAQGEDLS